MPNEDNAQLQEMGRNFLISDDWAELDVSQIDSLQAIVELFDQGYQSIFFTKEGIFQGGLSINLFHNAPRCTTEEYRHTFLFEENGIIHSDEVADRLATAEMKNKYPWCDEFPVVDDKKKILQVMSWPFIFDDKRKKDYIELQKIEWQLVNPKVAKEFFGEKKILISSMNGNLQGFYEAFKDYLNITVFKDGIYKSYQNYDVIIYASPCWKKECRQEQYLAREIYADLLAESLVRYLKKNNVKYHFYDVEEPLPDLEKRESNIIMTSMPDIVEFRHSYHDYYFSRHSSYAGVDANVGERPTVESGREEHRIFIFGGCVAYSVFSTFAESHASELQHIVNLHDVPYKVINCGSIEVAGAHFTDFNNLYRIMDMNFKPGDIIVQFGRYLWRNGIFDIDKHHFVKDIFLKPETMNMHCFGYPPKPPILSHFDTEANKYVAEDIYEHIKDDLVSEVQMGMPTLKPYFSLHSGYKALSDETVAVYLSELHQYARNANSGFISLKGEFLEKEFLIINHALSDVEHLYIHVHSSQKQDSLKRWISQQNLENKIDFLPEKKLKKKSYRYGMMLRVREEDFCPLDDLYIFSHYIATVLNVRKYFLRECDFAEHREFIMVCKEYLERAGIDVVVSVSA